MVEQVVRADSTYFGCGFGSGVPEVSLLTDPARLFRRWWQEDLISHASECHQSLASIPHGRSSVVNDAESNCGDTNGMGPGATDFSTTRFGFFRLHHRWVLEDRVGVPSPARLRPEYGYLHWVRTVRRNPLLVFPLSPFESFS